MLVDGRAKFPLALALRRGEATLGETMAFLSGLYFRGKLAYARAFAQPPDGLDGALVITPSRGLMPASAPLDARTLAELGEVDIDAADSRYRRPLERDARALGQLDSDVVLLGSIASRKYVEVLESIFGERLLFPTTFVGRGDMSRGGLLLRCVRAGVELDYAPVRGAVRHGARPPKLPPLPRRAT
jgi:hypothetical protein